MTYDQYLNSNDSLLSQENNRVTPFDFHTGYTQNIIDTGKVSVLDFGVLQGGTATLGGTVNGNGLMSVKNNAGTEIVRVDSNGITINTGSMTIKDGLGTTIVDGTGLVSANNFNIQVATVSSGSTTVNYETSYDPVPGGTITLSRPRTSVYLIGMNVLCRNNKAAANETVLFKFEVGGTRYGPDVVTSGEPGTNSSIVSNETATGLFITSLPAGTSNLILKYATSGAGTAVITSINENQLFAIKFGN